MIYFELSEQILNVIFYDLKVNQHIKVFEGAPLIVLDGNAPQATIDHVLALCKRLNKPGKVIFENIPLKLFYFDISYISYLL